jgi:hypothetical protein
MTKGYFFLMRSNNLIMPTPNDICLSRKWGGGGRFDGPRYLRYKSIPALAPFKNVRCIAGISDILALIEDSS